MPRRDRAPRRLLGRLRPGPARPKPDSNSHPHSQPAPAPPQPEHRPAPPDPDLFLSWVRAGDYDDHLEHMLDVIGLRSTTLLQQKALANLRVGDQVRFNRYIDDQDLEGNTGEIVQIAHGQVEVCLGGKRYGRHDGGHIVCLALAVNRTRRPRLRTSSHHH